MSRTVPFSPDERCDSCGALGAFDFMGDLFCDECAGVRNGDENMNGKFEYVEADTLFVTHIYDGEEVVAGGQDGQVWVATFASRNEAEEFVTFIQDIEATVEGLRGPIAKLPTRG